MSEHQQRQPRARLSFDPLTGRMTVDTSEFIAAGAPPEEMEDLNRRLDQAMREFEANRENTPEDNSEFLRMMTDGTPPEGMEDIGRRIGEAMRAAADAGDGEAADADAAHETNDDNSDDGLSSLSFGERAILMKAASEGNDMHNCDNCKKYELLFRDDQKLFPCASCGTMEYCSAGCQEEHLNSGHDKDCTAAQVDRQKARVKSRQQAEKFDADAFESRAAEGGWDRNRRGHPSDSAETEIQEAVRAVIVRTALAWSQRGQDAVLVVCTSSAECTDTFCLPYQRDRYQGRYLPLQFVGIHDDEGENEEEQDIELRYVNLVDDEERAKSFLHKDTYEEIDLPREVFEALFDELLLRNWKPRDEVGNVIWDFRPGKIVHHTILASSKWMARGVRENLYEEKEPVTLDVPFPRPPAGASCWICLDDEDDDQGQPIRRECSCRGSAGFVHLSCAVGNSRRLCEKAFDRSHDRAECRRAFEFCPTCHQKYEPRMAYDLAAGFVNWTKDREESHMLRIIAMLLFGKKCIEVSHYKKARKYISPVLEVIQTLDRSDPARSLEADALSYLGGALRGNGEYSLAMKVFDDSCELLRKQGDAPMLEKLEAMVDTIKDRSGSDIVKRQTKVRQDLIREKGITHHETISASVALATSYYEAGFHLKGQELLEETIDIAKRALGPDHESTGIYEDLLPLMKRRGAHLLSQNGEVTDEFIQVLKLSKDGTKYIVRLDGGKGAKVKVPLSRVAFVPNTPVIIIGSNEPAIYFNGKTGRVKGSVAQDRQLRQQLVEFPDGASFVFDLQDLRVIF